MRKGKKYICLLLCLICILGMSVVVFAEPGIDPITRLANEMNSTETQDMAWGIATPFAKLAGVVIMIIAIVALIADIAFLAICALKAARGKGDIGKRELKIFFIALFIALLILGGGWATFAKAGKKVIVDPTTQVLDGSTTGTTNTQTQTTPAPTPAPTPKPDPAKK